MTLHELYLLSPEISMALLAGVIIILDLIFKNKKLLPIVGFIGLLVPLFFSISLTNADPNNTGFYSALIVDKFSLFFKYLIIFAVAIVLLISIEFGKKFGKIQGEYYSLVLLSASGMLLLVSATELITIYIALELTALPTAALAAFGRNGRSSESGLKFLLLSAISSAILLYGMVLTYGFTGTTYLPEIVVRIQEMIGTSENILDSGALLFGIILITAGFGFKISAVPFQMWAPDVYEGAPTPITGFLSVASKAAGFAIILRIFYSAFDITAITVDWSSLVAILSAISMSVGNLVAIRQQNIKRMLAYSTIAQAGYIMVGLAALSTLPGGQDHAGPAGILFYLAGYAMTNLAAFAVITAVANNNGGDESISSFGGLLKRSPTLTAIMTLSMISLIGIPPTVGFMAKIYIFGSAMDTGLEWLAIIGVINSVISAYYYLRVVKVMFSESDSALNTKLTPEFGTYTAAIVGFTGTFIFGIYPTPIIDLAQTAIKSIML